MPVGTSCWPCIRAASWCCGMPTAGTRYGPTPTLSRSSTWPSTPSTPSISAVSPPSYPLFPLFQSPVRAAPSSWFVTSSWGQSPSPTGPTPSSGRMPTRPPRPRSCSTTTPTGMPSSSSSPARLVPFPVFLSLTFSRRELPIT